MRILTQLFSDNLKQVNELQEYGNTHSWFEVTINNALLKKDPEHGIIYKQVSSKLVKSSISVCLNNQTYSSSIFLDNKRKDLCFKHGKY